MASDENLIGLLRARGHNNIAQQLMNEAADRIEQLTVAKPRPLRELIAEGHEQFWIKAHGFDEYSIAALIEDAIWINDDDVMACYTKEHFADCPAIPILKPAIDGGGK